MPSMLMNRCYGTAQTTRLSTPPIAPNWPRACLFVSFPNRNTTALPERTVRASVSSAPAIVDDQSVPEAHKGLHTFLYGQGGAEEHEHSSAYSVRKGEDEGAAVVPVPVYLEARDGEKPIGVYCLYDAHGAPQYIGYSRNMVLAIKTHLARVGPERCASVRAVAYGNRAMASRATLERGVANWVSELPELAGSLPPGNADPGQRAAWEGGDAAAAGGGAGGGDGAEVLSGGGLGGPAVLDRRLMSPGELATYEEKKLKMRKAMGEKMVEGPGSGSGDHGHRKDETGEDDPEERRRKLMKAMDRGDWSAVIHAQTQETLADGLEGASTGGSAAAEAPGERDSSGGGDSAAAGGATASSSSSGGGAVVSPFQEGGAGAASVASMASMDDGAAAAAAARGGGGRARPPLTVAAVQAALEEVRPYLMADGGDVEVVDVENGVVYLRLQGACSSCPSQSATMKGGIERTIKQTFGDQVRDILQLDKVEDPKATVAQVDMALNMLRGAIHNYGGKVEVLSVEDGVCTLRYSGPPAIGKGIQGALRDSFRDIKEIRMVD